MGVHNGIKGCGRELLKFILEERLLMWIYITPNAGGGLREIPCQGLDESEVATSINAKFLFPRATRTGECGIM